jgi:hypothetical protein
LRKVKGIPASAGTARLEEIPGTIWTKDERIATFEPHHCFAQSGLALELGHDFGLHRFLIAVSFADVNPFAALWDQFQNGRTNQPVVENHVGLLEGSGGFDGQQVRVAGSSANNPDRTDRC